MTKIETLKKNCLYTFCYQQIEATVSYQGITRFFVSRSKKNWKCTLYYKFNVITIHTGFKKGDCYPNILQITAEQVYNRIFPHEALINNIVELKL